MSRVVCFTGHRPGKLAGYEECKYRLFVRQLTDYLYGLYCDKEVCSFISGGAQGFDQLSFFAVQRLKRHYHLTDIQNIVYAPFVGQQTIWKACGCFSQQMYHTMINLADEVRYTNDPPTTKSEIIAALYDRNHKMVDASDMVIALYNGQDYRVDKGGTAECMRYADKSKVEILHLSSTINDDGDLTLL